MHKRRDVVNETTEMWREHRRDIQAYKAEKRCQRTKEIETLSMAGFKVERLTEFQFRIDGVLDLFPTGRRWHNIKTGKRGTYDIAIRVVKGELRRG